MAGHGTCHVWWVEVSGRAGHWALLDEQERRRAREFAVEHARSTFLTSRAAQRQIAGAYLGLPASEVVISRVCAHCGADHGRPVIPGAGFDYSVAHTRDWVAVAVVGSGLVGIDIENRSPGEAGEVASLILSQVEAAVISAALPESRDRLLTRIWARKEAVTKLTGHGLAADFREIDVSGDTVTTRHAPAGWPAEQIHLRDLPGRDSHVAALASTVPLRSVESSVWGQR